MAGIGKSLDKGFCFNPGGSTFAEILNGIKAKDYDSTDDCMVRDSGSAVMCVFIQGCGAASGRTAWTLSACP